MSAWIEKDSEGFVWYDEGQDEDYWNAIAEEMEEREKNPEDEVNAYDDSE